MATIRLDRLPPVCHVKDVGSLSVESLLGLRLGFRAVWLMGCDSVARDTLLSLLELELELELRVRVCWRLVLLRADADAVLLRDRLRRGAHTEGRVHRVRAVRNVGVALNRDAEEAQLRAPELLAVRRHSVAEAVHGGANQFMNK